MGANWHMSPSPGSTFVEKGPNSIGSRYKKVVYREYTDDTFSVQKKRLPSQQHLEIMGKFSCTLCCLVEKTEKAEDNVCSLPPL